MRGRRSIHKPPFAVQLDGRHLLLLGVTALLVIALAFVLGLRFGRTLPPRPSWHPPPSAAGVLATEARPAPPAAPPYAGPAAPGLGQLDARAVAALDRLRQLGGEGGEGGEPSAEPAVAAAAAEPELVAVSAESDPALDPLGLAIFESSAPQPGVAAPRPPAPPAAAAAAPPTTAPAAAAPAPAPAPTPAATARPPAAAGRAPAAPTPATTAAKAAAAATAAVRVPDKTAAPARPAPRKQRFTLQVSSFQDRAEADELVRALRSRGHNPYLVVSTVPERGGRWFRVRVGRFSDRDAAEEFRTRFEQQEGISTFISPL